MRFITIKKPSKSTKKALLPHHPKCASTLNNIGAIYDAPGQLNATLSYYRHALDIYGYMHSHAHPNIIRIRENIERIKSKIKK